MDGMTDGGRVAVWFLRGIERFGYNYGSFRASQRSHDFFESKKIGRSELFSYANPQAFGTLGISAGLTSKRYGEIALAVLEYELVFEYHLVMLGNGLREEFGNVARNAEVPFDVVAEVMRPILHAVVDRNCRPARATRRKKTRKK